MKILITGAQGSGKTTQANILAERLGFSLIKLGDLLREFAQGDGEENKRIAEELSKGDLVDDAVAARLIKKRFENSTEEKGSVTDGYPRRMHQMELFDPHYDKVFNLVIDDQVGVKRLLARGRGDDTPEAIEKRLSWYHQETEPVLEHYKREGILVEVDGEKSIEEVTNDILAHLKV
jgi:adenylate kinase